MPKHYGITYRFLEDIIGNKQSAQSIRVMFHRKGWSINNPNDVREFLNKNLNA